MAENSSSIGLVLHSIYSTVSGPRGEARSVLRSQARVEIDDGDTGGVGGGEKSEIRERPENGGVQNFEN